jgi:peptidoglycan-associated lipoprotein
MIATPLRLCVALLLLAACGSTPDEVPPPMDPDAAAAGAGQEGADGGGITTSNLPEGVQPGSQEDLEVSVGDRVFFGYDSTVLAPVATQTLDRQAAWLQQYPDVTVTIEGHADERGTREYNLALGDRRANAVKNYLSALNIDGNRILTISYGEERPAVPGGNEEAWAQNRRAVTVVNTVN